MKLSLDALKERAEATASTELLVTISGGTANACHDTNAMQSIGNANAGANTAYANGPIQNWFWGLFGL
jgi:hypothetical protein